MLETYSRGHLDTLAVAHCAQHQTSPGHRPTHLRLAVSSSGGRRRHRRPRSAPSRARLARARRLRPQLHTHSSQPHRHCPGSVKLINYRCLIHAAPALPRRIKRAAVPARAQRVGARADTAAPRAARPSLHLPYIHPASLEPTTTAALDARTACHANGAALTWPDRRHSISSSARTWTGRPP